MRMLEMLLCAVRVRPPGVAGVDRLYRLRHRRRHRSIWQHALVSVSTVGSAADLNFRNKE